MFFRIIVILCLIANSVFAFASQDNRPLIVGSEEDFPPFAIGRTEETAGGYSVDLWKEVARETGLKYSMRVRPWGEILQEFKEGKIDVLINIAQSDERGKFTDFSVPHVTVHGAVFVRKGDSSIQKEADLAGKSIIVFNSDLAHEYAISKGWQNNLVVVSTAQEGLELLSSGKHDAMLLSKLSGIQKLKELKISNIKALDVRAGYAQKFSFGVRKGESELLAILNEGLALTKSSGAHEDVYNRWFGVYEERKITIWHLIPAIVPVILVALVFIFHAYSTRRIERRKAHEALMASEAHLRLILDSTGEGIYGTDLQGNCTFCNHSCITILRYNSQEDLLGKRMHDMIHHTRKDGFCNPVDECQIYKSTLSGDSRHFDGELLWRSDGTSFYADCHSYPQFKNGKIVGIVVTFVDISKEMAAEEHMKNLTQRLQLATSAAQLGVWDWNVTENSMYWDQRMFELYGITPDRFSSNLDAWLNGLHPDDKDAALSEYQAALKGEKDFDTTFRVIHPDGKVKHLKANAIVFRGGDGTAERMIGINVDITEIKRAEEEKLLFEQQYQQTQKLESLGVLAGGIAHDFNNILAIIIGYCYLTKVDYQSAEKNISEIERAAERAAGLCRQMLAYAGQATLSQSLVNTQILAGEMVTMLKATLSQNVLINVDLGSDIPTITGDASQIRQVIMNLIINASEAIGDSRGEVNVSIAKKEIPAGASESDKLGNTIYEGHFISIRVADNGCGMDDYTQQRIFEPFFTTKFMGRGLGMSAVLGIIKAHNGLLQFESEPGRGSTFEIYLPVGSINIGSEALSPGTASDYWRGSGTVLLAEDEEHMRVIATAQLKGLGFEVIYAADGSEALELYQRSASEICAVITDIGMPVMNGYELFKRLKVLKPKLPIIISSGFGEGDIYSKIPAGEIAGLINKPYHFEDLREVLRNVFGLSANGVK